MGTVGIRTGVAGHTGSPALGVRSRRLQTKTGWVSRKKLLALISPIWALSLHTTAPVGAARQPLLPAPVWCHIPHGQVRIPHPAAIRIHAVCQLTEVCELAPGSMRELPILRAVGVLQLHQLQHQGASGDDTGAAGQEVASNNSLQHGRLARTLRGERRATARNRSSRESSRARPRLLPFRVSLYLIDQQVTVCNNVCMRIQGGASRKKHELTSNYPQLCR